MDFSSGGATAILSSVPGKHGRETMNHFGHLRLRHVLKENVHGAAGMPQHRTPTQDKSEAVVCNFSSLGSIEEKLLSEEFGRYDYKESAEFMSNFIHLSQESS